MLSSYHQFFSYHILTWMDIDLFFGSEVLSDHWFVYVCDSVGVVTGGDNRIFVVNKKITCVLQVTVSCILSQIIKNSP